MPNRALTCATFSATLLACNGVVPVSQETDSASTVGTADSVTPQSTAPRRLDCWVTHTTGLFEPYSISPKVGDQLEPIVAAAAELESLTALNFQDEFSFETTVNFPGPAVVVEHLSSPRTFTLTATSDDTESSLVIDVVTNPFEGLVPNPEVDGIIWLRLSLWAAYVSNARLECSAAA